jgi:hypothetical protein
MSSLLSQVFFVDREDLEAVVLEFSERVRRDAGLRPALDRLVGNRWGEAEQTALGFLGDGVFGDKTTEVDIDVLALATSLFDATDVWRVEEILLDCALVCLPLHSAARISAVAEEFGRALRAIMALDGGARQRLLVRTRASLASGALLSTL